MPKPKNRFIKCEICGLRSSCINNEKRMFMAKFPLDEARCRQWVKVVGNEDFIDVPIEKLHSLKYVCGSHFRNKDFNRKKSRLKKFAVPSLNLKAAPLRDEMLLDFPTHINTTFKVTIKQLESEECEDETSPAEVEVIAEPSISAKDHNYCSSKPKTVVYGSQSSTMTDVFDNGSYSQQHSPCSPEPSTLTADTAVYRMIPQKIILLSADVTQGVEHREVSCDHCKAKVYGFRYKCVECADCDLCSVCEARGVHPDHYVLRIPQPLQFRKAQALVDRIRNAMADEGLFQKQDAPQPFNTHDVDSEDCDNLVSIKLEPIEEPVLKTFEVPLIDAEGNAVIAMETDSLHATDVEFSNQEDEGVAVDTVSAASSGVTENKVIIKRLYSNKIADGSSIKDDNINFKKAKTKDLNDPGNINLQHSLINEKQSPKNMKNILREDDQKKS